jgi:cytochrome P450
MADMTVELASAAPHNDDLYNFETLIDAGGGELEDPYPLFAQLLGRGPVHKGSLAECLGLPPERNGGGYYAPGTEYYTVVSFDAVSDVFVRKDDFGVEAYLDMGIGEEFGDTILTMEGLRHRRYRNLVQEYFQPGAAAGWWHERVIASLVEELIDGFADRDSVDLNTEFFGPLPLQTMTMAFGMSPEEGIEFRRQMAQRVYDRTPDGRSHARDAAGRILESIIRERQAEPRDDLISRLGQAEVEEDDGSRRRLSLEEIASFCRLVMFAGGETTWRQLGIALYALLNHPDQLAAVAKDRSLLKAAILESTRWHSDALFPRKVMRDTELYGVELPAGVHLHVCIGAANRDPSRWENPDRFDVHRPFHRSVAFGAGVHSCLGQHVARQEIATAIGALLDRFPNIRWDPSKPPARITGSMAQRGPGELHVLLQ